ncbi:52 kDa repressor of the inhibitor of the protein kinase-like [Aphis craccivora]|uniref:52 kDa repressor of the inhibitor of the protein kinase-like n=1 Tax=Aphis craccivora TaxID=307492 RepID=A0A6G0Y1R9_APHCR|nr:52 kDa repressor of the inhibitor of the protein kinase-like [Aphis craccivora]
MSVINEYPWLSYSQKHGGGFCRICVLFGFDEGGRSRIKLGKLVTLPLSTYKKRAIGTNQNPDPTVINKTPRPIRSRKLQQSHSPNDYD